MMLRRWMRTLPALLGLAVAVAAPVAMADVTVLAAASMKNALEEVAATYTAETGVKVVQSFAASSALAKQIEAGAPADLFVSADLEWMDYLQQRKLINADTRRNLVGNALVLVAPTGSPATIQLVKGVDLTPLLGADGRLATGDPSNVPVGRYAKTALEHLGTWSAVEPRLARAENVRVALSLVSRGEAPLGIVYSTDAAVDKGVKVIATFPADSHPAIIYPVAVTTASTDPGADGFLAYLASGTAKAIFDRHGFTTPSDPKS